MYCDQNGDFLVSAFILGGIVIGGLFLSGCSKSNTSVYSGDEISPLAPGSISEPLAPIPLSSVPMTSYEKEVQLAVAQTIYGEAGGSESHSDWRQGQEAVAWTIINRIESTNWPDDALSVVTQPNQYVGYAGGKRHYENGTCNVEMWDYAYALGKSVAIGDYASVPMPSGITNFHTSFRQEVGQPHEKWGRRGVVTYGGNTFFY